MRLAHPLQVVLPVEGRSALLLDVGVLAKRLATAADTATEATHNLDEVIAGFAGFNLIEYLLRLSERVNDGHAQSHAV